MEVKEAFHKWANGGKTVVAYGPRDEGGYSLLEYSGGKPKELFRSDSLEEIQAAFRNYYAVKAHIVKAGVAQFGTVDPVSLRVKATLVVSPLRTNTLA